jgi:hypothetical protein
MKGYHNNHSHNYVHSHHSKSDTITLGEFDTEIEAAQAYNIGALIFNGMDTKFNDVPTPSIDTFDKVIKTLMDGGWRVSENEMKQLKFMATVKLGMKFLELDQMK